MSSIPSIADVDVSGKTVLVRADINAPMADGKVTDMTRIERFAPTVTDLINRGAKVVVMTHVGRPKGSVNPAFTTQPLCQPLSRSIGAPVKFVRDCVGASVEASIAKLNIGGVILLENLRFYAEEEANDETFALRLSINGDIYVNDAFSCAHRAHASTQAITKRMPSYAGPSLLAEVTALSSALEDPERPVAALVGGAKVSSKIDVLKFLVPKMDVIIIGGGMANTFVAAQGHSVGKSLCEVDVIPVAQEVLALAEKHKCHLVLPDDMVVAKDFAANAKNRTVGIDAIGDDEMALDVGAKTIETINTALDGCKTLLWNGPLGAFEMEPFGTATFAVAVHAAKLTKSGSLTTIAGGGDTVAALNSAGAADDFTYVSTAGGAFLEWLEGKELPGIAALSQN